MSETHVLIKDLRLYFDYQLLEKFKYLNRYADLVGRLLVERDFKCPGYHHLYISIADTYERAQRRAIVAENWYTFGAAILTRSTLFKADVDEQQTLVLAAIKNGLLSIAERDGLDTGKILESIEEARRICVLEELPFKFKENNKIAFMISTKTILGESMEEVYFTLINKKTERVARWKFAEENILVLAGWIGTITVTNKVIRTKPRAYMDLVLAGKQKCLEIDVEKELADEAKMVVIDDVSVWQEELTLNDKKR